MWARVDDQHVWRAVLTKLTTPAEAAAHSCAKGALGKGVVRRRPVAGRSDHPTLTRIAGRAFKPTRGMCLGEGRHRFVAREDAMQPHMGVWGDVLASSQPRPL